MTNDQPLYKALSFIHNIITLQYDDWFGMIENFSSVIDDGLSVFYIPR